MTAGPQTGCEGKRKGLELIELGSLHATLLLSLFLFVIHFALQVFDIHQLRCLNSRILKRIFRSEHVQFLTKKLNTSCLNCTYYTITFISLVQEEQNCHIWFIGLLFGRSLKSF